MDYDTKAFIAMKIGALLNLFDDPDSLLAVVATCLHFWAEEHDQDVTILASLLQEAVIRANGLEIEGEGDND